MADSHNGTQDTDELIALRHEVAQLKTNLAACYELGEMGQWEADLTTGKVHWSKTILQIFEIPDDVIRPQSFEDFLLNVYPDDRNMILNDWVAVRNKNAVITRQSRIVDRFGKPKYIRSMMKSVFRGDDIISIQGVVQDITSIVAQELNNNLDQLAHDLFKDHELTWMGGYEIDLRTDELVLSRSVLRILEIEPEAAPRTLLQFFDTCVAPADREMVRSITREIRNQTPAGEQYRIGPNAFQLHYRVITSRSLQVKHVISRYIRIFESDVSLKINGLLVDVTLTKNYEDDLIRSREQFKLLFDNMRQGVSFHEKDGRTINFNAAAQQITGLKTSEYLHKYPFELNVNVLREDGTEMPQEEYPVLQTIRFGLAVHNAVFGIMNPFTHIIKWLRVSFIPIRSTLFDQEGFFSLFEDISDSKRSFELLHKTNAQLHESLQQLTRKNKVIKEANNKLKKTRKELSAALQQLELKTKTLNELVLLMVTDLSGHIIEVNDRFLEVLGYKRHEVIGMPGFLLPDNMFHSGAHSPGYYGHRRELVSQGSVWRGEICEKTKTGKLIWLLQTIMPLKNALGEIERIYFYNSEITPLKRREQSIRHEKRVAEEASRIKEEFLSLMSHEIRTPLNSVIGLTNLLLRRNPREDQMEMVQALKNSSDNLLYLVNSILDYNKLQAGKIAQEQNQFNLFDYIRHIHISFRMIALENGIQWELKVDPTLPEIVKGDMGRINQILNNLINNAIKFTHQGKIHLDVRLQARIEETVYVVFEIRDSGIGIPGEKLDKIFDPFYQVYVHGHEHSGGTGLGLAIVKGLVDLLNGHITVQSTLGEGAVFSVELPLQIPPPEEAQIITKKLSVDISINLKGCKVLYVEDVESNRFVVENILSDIDVEITTAGSGQEALLLTDKLSYDVILMDLQMPELDGYHTVDAIRQQARGKNKHTPIIAFTAKIHNEELKKNLAKHHIQDVIVKPFNTEVLLEKIAHARLNSPAFATGRKKIISFTFYEIALRYNKEKLSAVRKELLHEVAGLEADIKTINKNKTMQGTGIQDRIHRLRPIAKNLECESLRVLLDEYRNHTRYGEELKELNRKTVSVLKMVRKTLEELPY